MGNSHPGDVESAGQVYLHDHLPRIGIHAFDRSRGSGDAGIVHQHVEAAQIGDGVDHHSLDVLTLRDIANLRQQAGNVLGRGFESFRVDIADADLRRGRRKGPCDLLTDARGSGRNQNALYH